MHIRKIFLQSSLVLGLLAGSAGTIKPATTPDHLVKAGITSNQGNKAQAAAIPARTGQNQYRLNPIPDSLDQVRGIHPRLYLTSERVNELRQAILSTHQSLWVKIRLQADRAVRRGPPVYIKDDGHSGEEQLWQREVGNAMPLLAMAFVMTGENQYLEAARAWAMASCNYPTWGLGRIDGMDLATGHQLFGLGLLYDWCYHDLDEPTRRTIRETLIKRTSAMFEAAVTGKAWWRQSYLQNHLWVDICGMAVAGLALFDEVDNANDWIGLPLEIFQRTMKALGDDGASHEGYGYWEYGVENLLKFMALARQRLEVNLYDHPWWRNTAQYAQYLALPRRAWTARNSIVDLADCPRSHWYGPDYLLRALAREYRDPQAQWLAQQFDIANVEGPSASWLNLIWYDPTVPAQAPASLPALHHFTDMGIVSTRTDWSGNESLLVFKCGPFIGHQAVQEFSNDPGGGHVHPDANHFVLFGGDEWLIRDDGYRAKWTGQHNTLLINGRGQLGEGAQWFNGTEPLKLKARPRILRAVSAPQLDQITGDATEAYPRNLGLRHYRRHLLFLKPDVLVVVDDVLLDQPGALELRFHPEVNQGKAEGQTAICAGQKTLLRLENLTPKDVQFGVENLAVEGRQNEKNVSMFTIRLRTTQAHWMNATALTWASLKNAAPHVTLQVKANQWEFSAGNRVVTFNPLNGEATVRTDDK